MLRVIERLGQETISRVEGAGRMGVFLLMSVVGIFLPPVNILAMVKQIHIIGSMSLSLIIFTGAFTGAVLGLQGYHTLSQFGSVGMLGSAVALSLLRELGPVLSALMVTGRAGSAICAELGIMRISEQIDALECMAIDPYRFLIAPKVIACLISVPILNFVFIVVGIFGGWLAGVKLLGVNEGAYFAGMSKSVEWADINMAIIKSMCFGLLIVWICAAKGFFVHLDRKGGFGAEGVSRATTMAVVMTSVSILVWDYLITSVML
ncbi:MAG: ABC transporter permease [Deltaproteobacteria bacterium]|nr:ABC transporter permease [Deltaproteobacteria bacterium]